MQNWAARIVLSSQVLHVLHIINYGDNFVGVATPDVGHHSYDTLRHLGLNISDKKLVAPCTRAVCLGVEIDSERSTISIPAEKLQQICDMVTE